MRRIALFTLSLFGVVATAEAAVSGKMGRKGVVVEVVDAVLYEGETYFGGDKALILRLSAAKFDQAAIDEAINLEVEIDRQLEGVSNVTLEFAMNGAWSGGGGFYIPEASCGWCQDSVIAELAKTKFEKNVLTGTIQVRSATLKDGDGPDLDLTLSVPLSSAKGLVDLPKGGGDVGKAFLACTKALADRKKADKAAVIAACFATSDSWVQNLNLEDYPEFSDLVVPVRMELSLASILEEVKILGGRKKGKRAELDIEGKQIDRSVEPPYVEKHKGQVFLELTAEGWRLRGSRLEQVFE
jgi:hypothetical protein